MKKILTYAEWTLILGVALAPVFASFPYRINIFLSWEGAYRLSEGQIPYKDFGMPVGYMYWVVPAVFFKIFGAQMITLIKAQAFLNILASFSFRSIFKSLDISPAIRFLAIVVFTLSYTFLNYWPWYNNTVIIYELLALAFLFRFLVQENPKKSANGWLLAAGAFIFFSFFTKQDGGGLALLLCWALLLYNGWRLKKWFPLFVFTGTFAVTGLLMIVPLLPYGFGYWFNYGQPPHSSRISIADILREFFIGSQWLKFYIFIISLLLIVAVKKKLSLFSNRIQMLFLLLTAGILTEAVIFQVTSYVPLDNNIFFHSFAVAFILYLLSLLLAVPFENRYIVIVSTLCVFIWWSPVYWKYVERFVLKKDPVSYSHTSHNGYSYADVVNKNTYMIELDTTGIPLNKWRSPTLPSFRKMLLPGATVDGIERLLQMDMVKNKKFNHFLNLTELTPLTKEVPYLLEKGMGYPLWFHKGVAMFDKETNMFVNRIDTGYYDIVLYEYIPYLNNFYPYKIREALQAHYQKTDSFPAPRFPSSNAWIEVFVKRLPQ